MPFGRNFGSFRYFTWADPAMSKLKVPLIHQNENSFSRTTLALAERTFSLYDGQTAFFASALNAEIWVVIVLFIPMKHILVLPARELTYKK